jgi:hypothetical protein
MYYTRRSPAVLVGVVMTCVGGACMIVAGLLFLFGSGPGSFLGEPTERVGLAGAWIPTAAAGPVGAVLALVGVALVWLAVAVRRGGDGARIGLTFIGGVFACVQLTSVAVGDPGSAIPPLVWMATAVALLWAETGRSVAVRATSARPPAPWSGRR